MTIGYIGLGKMGKNMVLRLLEQGIGVVAWNRSPEPLEEVASSGAQKAGSVEDVAQKLSAPRIIWLMLPNGTIIDEVIAKLNFSPGDIIIDGGNSFYKDSIRRASELEKKNIKFLDIGVSGGPDGARNGACLMVGGEKSGYDSIVELLKAAAAPDAYGHMGPSGAGHFVKMIHNGIEYGMMEALAEGAAILKKSPFDLDLAEIMRIYNNKSVIESRLVGWAHEIVKENPDLKNISSSIGQLGEGKWTTETAKEMGIEIPVIDASLEVRNQSAVVPENFRNKLVSALRGQFGKHEVQMKNHGT